MKTNVQVEVIFYFPPKSKYLYADFAVISSTFKFNDSVESLSFTKSVNK